MMIKAAAALGDSVAIRTVDILAVAHYTWDSKPITGRRRSRVD